MDGYSRLITFLKCNTDNKAATVLHQFILASSKYGLPSQVRSDHGTENTKVAAFITLVRGRQSHITGRSVHNQRIERLWRDVRTNVVEKYRNKFYSMEEDAAVGLNPADSKHIFALQYVYLPIINQCLEQFVEAWNTHKLRSEHNQTQQQLWLSGTLDNAGNRYTAPHEILSDGVDLETSLQQGLQRYGVNMEDLSGVSEEENIRNEIILTDEQLAELDDATEAFSETEKFAAVLEKLTQFGL